jgi:hypothetical protein
LRAEIKPKYSELQPHRFLGYASCEKSDETTSTAETQLRGMKGSSWTSKSKNNRRLSDIDFRDNVQRPLHPFFQYILHEYRPFSP